MAQAVVARAGVSGLVGLTAKQTVLAQRNTYLSGSRAVVCRSNAGSARVSMRASWLPGSKLPEYLDGLPGDFGFDPLGFGEVPENLARYQEAELIHCRWAMLGVAGALVPEALGLGNWLSAQDWAAKGGIPTYLGVPVPWGNLPTILAVEFAALAWAESQRNNETDPEKKKYPGGAFDPLGFSKDPAKLDELKLKEIKNGRLAIVAFLGFAVQAAVRPGTGPLENLASHLSDPWHNTVADIFIPRSIL